MGVKRERPLPLWRSDLIDLDGPERIVTGKHLCELLTQLGSFKRAIPEFVEGDALRLIARDLEHRVERPIAGLDPLPRLVRGPACPHCSQARSGPLQAGRQLLRSWL